MYNVQCTMYMIETEPLYTIYMCIYHKTTGCADCRIAVQRDRILSVPLKNEKRNGIKAEAGA